VGPYSRLRNLKRAEFRMTSMLKALDERILRGFMDRSVVFRLTPTVVRIHWRSFFSHKVQAYFNQNRAIASV
jgi:hypothetical protein